jgi:Zn-dependent peptidase ImmA (M78 family)
MVAHPQEDEEVVGRRIREALRISWEGQLGWNGPYAALNRWRSAIEDQGVMVFQTGDVELSEMRGTIIPHGPLPVILINNPDAPHGRVFTLIHEFCHILQRAVIIKNDEATNCRKIRSLSG